MPAIYEASQAEMVAAGLTATDLDGWTYAAIGIGGGKAQISVTDENGEFVDYLDLHLVASHQDEITRITGNGMVITVS
jgi:hypothetical protein